MLSRYEVVDTEPLLRPTPDELAVAPELGILAALDATLATAAYQLHAGHPELTLQALARGHLPSAKARSASLLIFRYADLRAEIRNYRVLALGSDLDEDSHLDLPF